MSDQAERLRMLAQTPPNKAAARDAASDADASSPMGCRMVFTSGKGGVGTSNLVLNLAIALGQVGHRVLVVDGDGGRAALDLLGGLTPRRDLGDVLAGLCEADQATHPLDGTTGRVWLLAGAHALRTSPAHLAELADRLARELPNLSRGYDFVLVDAGSGLGPGVAVLSSVADELVIVTTPEPAAVADAHAAIARARTLSPHPPEIRIAVCHAATAGEGRDTLERLAASSRQFLGQVVRPLGSIRTDRAVPCAVRRRRPFLLESPRGRASRGVRRLARSLARERPTRATAVPPHRLRLKSAFLNARATALVGLLGSLLGKLGRGPGPPVGGSARAGAGALRGA
jgi:flagellar biosynthesis protein FlhG